MVYYVSVNIFNSGNIYADDKYQDKCCFQIGQFYNRPNIIVKYMRIIYCIFKHYFDLTTAIAKYPYDIVTIKIYINFFRTQIYFRSINHFELEIELVRKNYLGLKYHFI